MGDGPSDGDDTRELFEPQPGFRVLRTPEEIEEAQERAAERESFIRTQTFSRLRRRPPRTT